MSPHLPVRRFAINPVEVLVFSIISVVFANSLYQAFEEREALSASLNGGTGGMIASAAGGAGRSPASDAERNPAFTLGTVFAALQTDCRPIAQHRTEAQKMRFQGIVCAPSTDSGKLMQATVINGSNQDEATVFTAARADRYSTDYVSLVPGTNRIRLEFRYQDGRKIARDIQVHRDAAQPVEAPAPAASGSL